MNLEKFDIVLALFPFADSNNYKKRPVLVLSSSKNLILRLITQYLR